MTAGPWQPSEKAAQLDAWLILAKLGIPAEEVDMLRRYCADVDFGIREQQDNTSAQIPLRRGFHQGDFISHLLGV